MIVFVGGMQRSGSTFSFNIVRELLQARGDVYQEPSTDLAAVVERAGRSSHIVVKGHSLDPFSISLVRHGAMKTVCTVRKPEIAITSWMHTFGFSLTESIDQMAAWLEMYRQIHPFVLTIDYDEIDQNPNSAAWQIAQYVAPDASRDEAIIIADRYQKKTVQRRFESLERDGAATEDVKFSYYDKETFFHRRHVSSDNQKLPEEDIALIRARLSKFLGDDGFVDHSKLAELPDSYVPIPTSPPNRSMFSSLLAKIARRGARN